MKVESIVALVSVLVGCGSTHYVAYRPDRAVVRSIPSEKAQDALRERLERATGVVSTTLGIPAHRVAPLVVWVDWAHVFITFADALHLEFSYEQVKPTIWMRQASDALPPPGRPERAPTAPIRPAQAMTLAPPEVWVYFWGTPEAGGTGILLPALDDAEVIVDALVSLGAHLGEGPPAPSGK